jgi:diguanylate cyclase (GGDEF)-like protein
MVPNSEILELPRRVLVIEDSELDREVLRRQVRFENLELIEARDGFEGLERCLACAPDLILLDLVLPGCDGFDVLRCLKNEPRTRPVPVIILSGLTQTNDKVKSLDMGAIDFVAKPFDPSELLARMRVALRTKYLQDLLEQRARLDGLTGLANRLALEERMACAWAECQRHGGPLAAWIADLDHFKRINDGYGHAAGDEVLRRAAAILRSAVRAIDFAARYGGEEFVVIAPQCDLPGALVMAERFRTRLKSEPIGFATHTIPVTASVGVASFSTRPDQVAPMDLLAHADQALYQAKESGRNVVKAWRPLEIRSVKVNRVALPA